MNLFVVYVGGKTETSLIEVHDIHFAIGDKIEDSYDQLRKQWWGTSQSLHLDAWGVVNSVEDYKVVLKHEPAVNQSKKLFFVNLGGYDLQQFTELHKNFFVIAENKADAKIKAKATVSHWEVPHTDGLYDVDDCVNVNELLEKQGLYIHLEHTDTPAPFNFICKYVPIGV